LGDPLKPMKKVLIDFGMQGLDMWTMKSMKYCPALNT
jgi:hypothetical protein